MTMPAPYPADTKAKGWRFELDHERIRQSDTWALAAPELRPWLLMLWLTAWEQVPCGSLPDDDELIAVRIGMPLDMFLVNKDRLLRGWWRADDGRLYHRTLTERVLDMLAVKDKERQRKADYRARVSGKRPNPPQGGPGMSHGTHQGHPQDSHGSDPGRDDTGTGTGSGTKGAKAAASTPATARPEAAASPPPSPPADPPLPPADPIQARAVAITLLLRQRGAALQASDPRVRRWAEENCSDAELLTALEIAERRRADAGNPQPVNAGYLDSILADGQGRSRDSPGRRRTHAEERAEAEHQRFLEMTREQPGDGQIIDLEAP